jgi:hypothetical protein
MSNTAMLYHVDGRVEEVTPRNGKAFTLEELQQFVGGSIEHVDCPNRKHMFINEEGKLLGLDINWKATEVSGIARYGDVIVGPAIVGSLKVLGG